MTMGMTAMTARNPLAGPRVVAITHVARRVAVRPAAMPMRALRISALATRVAATLVVPMPTAGVGAPPMSAEATHATAIRAEVMCVAATPVA